MNNVINNSNQELAAGIIKRDRHAVEGGYNTDAFDGAKEHEVR